MAWLLAGSVLHGQFAPPEGGAVPFRRDQLPINAGTMTDISRHLVAWAASQPVDSPGDRRNAARMLALAKALDPQNNQAGDLMKSMRDGRHVPAGDELPALGTARVWQTLAWLELPEAGDDGRTLAALLLDVAAVADPSHPRAEAYRGGENQAWNGWIPPLAAYTAPARPTTPRERVVPAPDKDEETKATPPMLAQATVRTVIWQTAGAEDSSSLWIPAPVPLEMQASLQPSSTPLRIGQSSEFGRIDRLHQTVLGLLAARGERIPETMRVRITSPGYEQAVAADMPRPVSAAAALLASAAVTGREPDAVIIGEVDATGRLSLPGDFWRMLRSLESGGGKLVLPAAAADWLPSLLAMDKARFFFDYEILLARDFDHLVTLSAKSPEGETAAACAQFAEIRSRAADGDVRDYLANRFVRQRLAEMSQQAPWHASAVMLHTQSAGKRPTTLSRPVLAAELRIAIRPMAGISAVARREFAERVFSDAETKSLADIHNRCREDIDRLEKLVARTDQDLFQGARALTASLRTLERNTRARGEFEIVQRGLWRELRNFSQQYRELSSKLGEEESKSPGSDH